MVSAYSTVWQEAAKEVWGGNPNLRAKYDNDFSSYWAFAYSYLQAKLEWDHDSSIRQEFQGDFNCFAAYKRSQAAGRTR